jgi:hypothetical protein
MVKITTTGLKEPYLTRAHDAAYDRAKHNLQDLISDKLKAPSCISRTSTAKYSSSVCLEANRLARELVKNSIREQGIKLSQVDPIEITKQAQALLSENPTIYTKATENLEWARAHPVTLTKDALVKP